jgi:hypothetical protein
MEKADKADKEKAEKMSLEQMAKEPKFIEPSQLSAASTMNQADTTKRILEHSREGNQRPSENLKTVRAEQAGQAIPPRTRSTSGQTRSLTKPPKRVYPGASESDKKNFNEWDEKTEEELDKLAIDFIGKDPRQINWRLRFGDHSSRNSSNPYPIISDSLSTRSAMSKMTDQQFVEALNFPNVKDYVEWVLTRGNSTWWIHCGVDQPIVTSKDPMDEAIVKMMNPKERANLEMRDHCKDQAYLGLKAIAIQKGKDLEQVAQGLCKMSVCEYLEKCCGELVEMGGFLKLSEAEEKKHEVAEDKIRAYDEKNRETKEKTDENE